MKINPKRCTELDLFILCNVTSEIYFCRTVTLKLLICVLQTNQPCGLKTRCSLPPPQHGQQQQDLYLWCAATASPGRRSSIFTAAGSPGALIQRQTTRWRAHAHARLHASNQQTDACEASLARRCTFTTTSALPRRLLKWDCLIKRIDSKGKALSNVALCNGSEML